MSVIGNNLANTNTVGFKGSRTVFADLLSSSINGSGGSSQVGRGVGMSKVDQIFSQGTFESTESGLDVAIEGEGFFILKEDGNETPYYSRAGAFRFDDNGYLINPEGYRVQGKEFDPITKLLKPGDATDIQVPGTGLIQGQATSTMKITTNLDASEPIIATAFSLIDPTTYNFSSSAQVFDSLGNPHLLTTYFTKTASNSWAVNWSAENSAVPPVVLTGALPALTFTTDGVLTGAAAIPPVPTTATIPALAWANGTTPTAIDVTFDTTQFNSASVVISQDQNGFGAGNLTGIDIDGDGIVIASYSNGEQTKVAQLVLGKFVNPNGLSLAGSNLYTETTSSGPARTGLPGPELGKVFTNSLEQSNVDMGAEFVRMITVQRGLQANSKIITTVDELLGELINLKR
jgi:flagellar hook protein FlgE